MVKIEIQTRNGVKVKVIRTYDALGLVGSVVEADCNCFGLPFRMHSNQTCNNKGQK